MAEADEMLAIDPGDVGGYWLRIRVLLARQLLEDAIATFREALDRWPFNDELRGQFAFTLLAAGRPDEAVAAVEEMGHEDATSRSSATKETVMARAGQVDRALELEPVGDPPRSDRHLQRAVLLLEARRFDDAVTETDRSLEAGARTVLPAPLLVILYLRRAEALQYLGRLDEADVALDAAEPIAASADILRLRVLGALGRDDVGSALDHVDEQLGRHPNDCGWQLLRAYLESERGDAAAARTSLARAAIALTDEFRDAHAPHAPSSFRRVSTAIGSLCAVLDWHAGNGASARAHAIGCLETLPPLLHEKGQQWDVAVERSLAHLVLGNRGDALEELQAASSDRLPLREPPGRFDLLASSPLGPPPGLAMVRGVVIDA